MSRRLWTFFCLLVVLTSPFIADAKRQQAPIRILFMHHSTGENLIWQGGVRESFSQLGYEFWDHNYNETGLTDAEGNLSGENWEVPDDNTDPNGWYNIFNQAVTDPPANTFSHMLEFDVILFKSCFPSSYIYDDEVLANYHRYYLSIRDVIDQHPDKLFIAFTPPPLVAESTDPASAARAQTWAAYLLSDEYLGGHPNLLVFDFFSLLADEQGYLRQEYRPEDPTDSHPNELANQIIAPLLVEFVDVAIRDFFLEGAAPSRSDDTVVEAVPPLREGMIDDFERGDFKDHWWSGSDKGALDFACTVSPEGYESQNALMLAFDLPPQISGGCGRAGLVTSAWAVAAGVHFYWRAEPAGLMLRMMVYNGPTPFEIYLPVAQDSEWVEVTLRWEDFVRAEWAEPGGSQYVDPALIESFDFVVGDWEKAQSGSVWIDSLELIDS